MMKTERLLGSLIGDFLPGIGLALQQNLMIGSGTTSIDIMAVLPAAIIASSKALVKDSLGKPLLFAVYG